MIKSKSVGDLGNDEPHILSFLDDVEDAKEVDVEEPSSSEKVNSSLSLSQLSILAAAFSSIVIPKNPHFMTKLCAAFKNAFIFSPVLIPKPISQVLFSIFMMIPSLSVVLSWFLIKVGVLSEAQIQRPIRYIIKIIRLISISVCLHAGDSIGYYLVSSHPARFVILMVDIFSYIIWNLSNRILYKLKFLDNPEKTLITIITEQMPFMLSFIFSVCVNSSTDFTGLIVYSSITIPLSIIAILSIISGKPFADPKWNKRALATIISADVFIVSNVLSALFPQIVTWVYGFNYWIVLIIIALQDGFEPPSAFKKTLKRRQKRAAYSEGLDDPKPGPSGRPFIHVEKQDIFNIIFFAFSALSTTYFNAIAAQRMPIQNALPDLVHDYFKVGEEIRGSPNFKQMSFSNLLCVMTIVGTQVVAVLIPDRTDVRKFFFLYAFMCNIRSVAFLVTSLPAPCSGLPHCPCADQNEIDNLKRYSPLWIAVTWTVGLGMFGYLPQCGDLIISGHTMFIHLSLRWICQVLRRVCKKSTCKTIEILTIVEFIFGASYITLSRNHYTIDVWLGFLLSEATFQLYDYIDEKSRDSTSNNIVFRFMRWFETRQYPIYKHRYGSAESSDAFDA